MPVVTQEEACARAGLSSSACAEANAQEIARRDLSIKTCARLFPGQEVMQTACQSSCRSVTSGNGQECAFTFAHSSRDVAVQRSGGISGLTWVMILLAVVVVTAVAALLRNRLKRRAVQ
ncbi:MAG: hypothetical protein M3O06_03220 [Pseudomonadota bacterium]|nr:hypothetical protein [Pseudomonadota bacterium]